MAHPRIKPWSPVRTRNYESGRNGQYPVFSSVVIKLWLYSVAEPSPLEANLRLFTNTQTNRINLWV